MFLNKKITFMLLLLTLQACTSVKAPYSTLFQTTPKIIKTSVGNVEVLKMGSDSSSKGTIYLVPGIPGSSLENVPLGHELSQKGYTVRLLNPPGHGQIAPGSTRWDFSFPLYGQALFESIQTLEAESPTKGEHILIAHSAGAEMALKLIYQQIETETLPKQYKIILINPWLPSISNHPLPWTSDDEDLLRYSPWLVKLFGLTSKASVHKRLFLNPEKEQNADYLNAHEKLTEDFGGWWPFDDRFVRLMKKTTHTQWTILQQGVQYELPKSKLRQLDAKLHRAMVQVIIINSSQNLDKVIPDDYKQSLEKALRSKLPNVSIKFTQGIEGGHMLQVEQLKRVLESTCN